MSEFSYLPLSDVSRSSRKSPGSGSEINGSSSSASGNALCLLGHSNGQVAQGEVPDPVLSTATVATTPPSTESSCRSSPSSAVTSPSPLSTIGHTHIPLRRDITSSPRRVSSTRVGSMTGMKNQGGGAPSSTSGFQGLGAHLNYMLNRDSRSTGNLANPINSIGNSTINSNALSESSSSGGILKNKLLKSNRNSLGDSLQPKSQSSDIGTPLMTPRGSPSPSQMSRTPSVKETHHISIDYDPVSGRKQLNTYEIIKELGRGQHGKVKLAKDLETGEFVAIKIVDRQGRPRLGRTRNITTQEDKIRREIAILKKCNHPNIVRLNEVLDDAKSRKIYLVLEYMEKGEIIWQHDDGSPSMPREMIRSTARDVLLGLEYLHFQGIIHRDIKPANLLLSKEGKVKISDFGVSYASSTDYPNDELELAKTAGTPAFFAPELCMSTSAGQSRPPITCKIDIWALGVTIFCLLYGKVPFMADSEFELFEVIVKNDLIFPDELDHSPLGTGSSSTSSSPPPNQSIPSMFYNLHDESSSSVNESNSSLSLQAGQRHSAKNSQFEPFTGERGPDLEQAKDLIRHMLEKDPAKRYTIDDIKRHPWICQGLDSTHLEQFLHTKGSGERIQVSGEELQQAVQGISGKIGRGLTRFGTTVLEFAGLRRKSSNSSMSSRMSGNTSRSGSQEPIPASKSSLPSRHKHHLSFSNSFANALPSGTGAGGSNNNSQKSPISSSCMISSSMDNTLINNAPIGTASMSPTEMRRSSTVSSVSASSSNRSFSRTIISSQSNLNIHSLLEGDNGYEADSTTSREPELSESSAPPSATNSSPTSLPNVFSNWPMVEKGKQTESIISCGLEDDINILPSYTHRQPLSVLTEVVTSDCSADVEEDSDDDSSDNSEGELTLVLNGPQSCLSRSTEDKVRLRPKMPRKKSSKKKVETLSQGDDSSTQDADNSGNGESTDNDSRRYRSSSITVGLLQRQNNRMNQ